MKTLNKELIIASIATGKIPSINPNDINETVNERRKYFKGKVTSSSINNNPLFLTVEEKQTLPIYSFYQHLDSDGTVVYAGAGDPTRATDSDKRRSTEHAQWLLQQSIAGRNPVYLAQSGLTWEQAKGLESNFLSTFLPKFNKRKS